MKYFKFETDSETRLINLESYDDITGRSVSGTWRIHFSRMESYLEKTTTQSYESVEPEIKLVSVLTLKFPTEIEYKTTMNQILELLNG